MSTSHIYPVMKYLLTLLLFPLLAPAQLVSFYVKPILTDGNYAASQDSHYVAINKSVTSNNKLLLFLPGTGALTRHYLKFPTLAASLGYHCVSVAYPNTGPTVAQLCAGNNNADCYKNIRQEVCYGTPVSNDVAVDSLNSIRMRLIHLLQYLQNTYPADGWAQFMAGGEPAWERIAVSGHSQGSGHALYLAKTQNCERNLMFAGADDYSNYYSQAANWTYTAGITPPARYFSFLHLEDEVWDYSKQYAVVQACGMTANGDDSTRVDNATAPYSNSHCLYTDIQPLFPGIYSAYHNGMVVDFYTPSSGGQPVYTPVWTYMLTEALPTTITEVAGPTFALYPNPSKGVIHLKTTIPVGSTELEVRNIQGELVLKNNLTASGLMDIDLSPYGPGVYSIRIGTAVLKVVISE